MAKKHINAGNANIPDYKTLKEIVVTGAQKGQDKRQFVFLDKDKNECERTFNQTWSEIAALGTFFYVKGLNGKKKIAVIGENCFEWMITYYATICGCNITVPMDAKLPYADLGDQLIRCDCDALVYTPKFNKAVEEFKANPDMPNMQYFCTENYQDFLKEGQAALDAGNKDFINAEVKPDDLACIAYTSGTTAKSKGVMLSHYNIASNCTASCRALNGRHAIGFLPLNHTHS